MNKNYNEMKENKKQTLGIKKEDKCEKLEKIEKSIKSKKNSFVVSGKLIINLGTTFTVEDRYEFIKQIGLGAYGVVCSCLDRKTNTKVAIKKVPNAFDDLIDAKRILREIKLLRYFDHENIISLLDVPKPDGRTGFNDIYIVTDLMETDLHRVIYSRQELSDDHIQYFVYQILRGVLYMHSANIVHRDLKPSNILANKNCDLKICDLGLGRGNIKDEESEKACPDNLTE
jgi:mitogen-activated protein kinase 1/3